MRALVRSMLLVGVAPGAAWACSGPGASEAIGVSIEAAGATWLATVVAAALVFALPRLRPRRLGFRLLWIGLPVLQTAAILLLGATRGDCGFMLRGASAVMAAVLTLAAAVGALRLSRAS